MRTSLLDIALSAGLEGFAPPSTDVEASDVSAINTELAASVVTTTDIRKTQINIADLTRLAGGLEGLMIEVTRVENKEDPTTEELAALRASAATVQREFLAEDERRLIDQIAEGRLEGSTEGLGDFAKSVSTKLGFAIGNFWDGLKRSVGKNKLVTDMTKRRLADLIARVQKLPDVPYSTTLSKDLAQQTLLNGKADPKGCFADIVPAIEDWYIRPVNLILNKTDELAAQLATVLATTTREEFDTLTNSIADKFFIPIPESAEKMNPLNGKYFTFDVYDVHRSLRGRCARYYVARPSNNSRVVSAMNDAALAASVAFVEMISLVKPSVKPENVTFTKEEMLNGLTQLSRAITEIEAHFVQMEQVYDAYGKYMVITRAYNDFLKHSFVNKDVQNIVGNHAGAILAMFELAFIPVEGTIDAINRLADVVKALVYSSDLSN